MKIINESDHNSVDLACNFLKQGKLIIFASDTIYGIAADANNSKAVEKLYQIKNRDLAKPIAIFIQNLESAKKIFNFDEISQRIASDLFPGALTMVLKLKEKTAISLAKNLNKNNDGFLGFRIINKKFICELLNKFGGILAVSSANKSSFEAARNCSEVMNYFSSQEDILLIDGGNSGSIASTVIKIDNGEIEILRQGAISKDKILNYATIKNT